MSYTSHLSPAQKTNAALTDVCRLLLDEYELTPEQIANLANDIPGECEAMRGTPAPVDDDDDDYYRPDESGYSLADEEWFFGMDGKP